MGTDQIRTTFCYEKEIIDPILNCIKSNKSYFSKEENLPELSKIGFALLKLWKVGEMCWDGYGIMWKKYRPMKDEDNQYFTYSSLKYKVENYFENDVQFESDIYSSWAMHHHYPYMDKSIEIIDYNNFLKILFTNNHKSNPLFHKENKNINEWIQVLTDKDYYAYNNYYDRKVILEMFLCDYGSGYFLNNDGYIKEKDSITIFGDWKNSVLKKDIFDLFKKLLNNNMLIESFDFYIKECQRLENIKISEGFVKNLIYLKNLKKVGLIKKGVNKNNISPNELNEKVIEYNLIRFKESMNERFEHYPIDRLSIISIINDEKILKGMNINFIDPTIIKASFEVYKNILENRDKEPKENVIFASKFLRTEAINKLLN